MILQHFADGLLTGAVVALGAIGLTLTMRILRFANFAHSELLTLGAYLAFAVYSLISQSESLFSSSFEPLSFGWALVIAALVAAGLTALVALLIDSLIFAKLRPTCRRDDSGIRLVWCGVINAQYYLAGFRP